MLTNWIDTLGLCTLPIDRWGQSGPLLAQVLWSDNDHCTGFEPIDLSIPEFRDLHMGAQVPEGCAHAVRVHPLRMLRIHLIRQFPFHLGLLDEGHRGPHEKASL